MQWTSPWSARTLDQHLGLDRRPKLSRQLQADSKPCWHQLPGQQVQLRKLDCRECRIVLHNSAYTCTLSLARSTKRISPETHQDPFYSLCNGSYKSQTKYLSKFYLVYGIDNTISITTRGGDYTIITLKWHTWCVFDSSSFLRAQFSWFFFFIYVCSDWRNATDEWVHFRWGHCGHCKLKSRKYP